ncbi:unnamed protein product [Blepharisma stoltei]|uniref:TAP42-like protein n=1 Tax=Blepharisma stoltei TaxID=1481888 RepID=A0AAU9J5Q8_9CILI|nr:unnamed protein product [Blepharisma stoltei]
MDTLTSQFAALKGLAEGFEEFKDLTPENVDNAILIANSLKQVIAREALFSSNELLEDLPTEHIKLLLTPYYHALVLLKNTDQAKRKSNLEFSQGSFEEFLNYLDNYRVVDEKFIERWKTPAEPTRDQKIADFKAKKAIEQQIQLLESRNNPDDLRDLYKLQLQHAASHTLDQLRFVKLELQVLEFKSTQETNPLPPPPPQRPPQILKIDESNVNLINPLISSGADIAKARHNIEHQVFQPGHRQPLYTIEEWGEIECKMCMEREEKQKQAELERKREQEENPEDYEEQKRKNDAGWDDWKDMHEKGAGNRNGR